MELDAVDRQVAVAEAHHRGVVGGGVDHQILGNVGDDQRVIARRREGRGQALEQPGAVMRDRAGLAMHQPAAHHLPAEMLANRLMTEADAEQGLLQIGAGGDEIEADPGLVRRARAGGDQEGLGVARDRVACGERVVTDDLNLGAQLHEVVDEVPGEAVIIVEDEDHAGPVKAFRA